MVETTTRFPGRSIRKFLELGSQSNPDKGLDQSQRNADTDVSRERYDDVEECQEGRLVYVILDV